MKQNKTIRNCGIKFRKQCSYKWELLEVTQEDKVRYCQICNRNVYFCETDEETIFHVKNNHCIARLIPDASELPKVVVGEPDAEWVLANLPTPQQEEARRLTHRENDINHVLQNMRFSSYWCKSCGYPVASWLKSCRVCGSSDFQEDANIPSISKE